MGAPPFFGFADSRAAISVSPTTAARLCGRCPLDDRGMITCMSTARLAALSGLLSLSVALFAQTKPAVPYGSNTTAGRTFVHEGVKL